MKNNWKTYKLGDVAKLRKTNIAPKNFNNETYIGLEHIGQGTFLLESTGIASDVTSNKAVFHSSDILYGKIRPYFKKVYKPKFSGICSTDILVINSIDENIVSGDYLYQLIKTQEFTDKATETSSGTKMPRADWNSLTNLKYKFPPIPEQIAIASILSALDDKIELNLQMNKTLEEMAMALYKHWFVDFGPFQNGKFIDSEVGMIPEGWEVKSIGDIVKIIGGYAFKSKDFSEVGEKVIKIKNISNNVVSVRGSDCIPSTVAEKTNPKFSIKPGAYLIAMTGAEVGKVGLVPDYKERLWLNQRVGMIDEPKFKFADILIGNFLQSQECYEIIQNLAYGSAQPNISSSGLESILMPIPNDASIIKSLLENLKSWDDMKVDNYTENQSLTTFRDTLLPKLISGEVRVKDVEKMVVESL
jgi:type I restriction enzyme S subunit